MKKLFILFVVAFWLCKSARAQLPFYHGNDTLSVALLQRVVNQTLTSNDSTVLKKQQQRFLVLNADTINMAQLVKLASGTLSAAEYASLKKQILKSLKIDSIIMKFNGKGLPEPNERMDTYDLTLPSCSFEKEANAMIIYDLGQMALDGTGIRVERHKRIKIFNEKGKNAANIRIDYTSQFGAEQIEEVEAKTINLNNGKIEYTELDPKLIYHQNLDKYHEAVLFSMPDVKAGSVVELAYVWHRAISPNIPGWNFQSDIPTRFSQYIVQLYRDVNFSSLDRTTFPLSKDSAIFNGYGHLWAMNNVPSIKIEPFMRSPVDGLQSIKVTVTAERSPEGKMVAVSDSWSTIGKKLANDKELSKTFDQKVSDKEGLVKSARGLSTTDAKVNYLFTQVKTMMRWNGERTWASKDGIKKAWENKSGNWGEINMALCKLLNDAGVKAYPMLASTRDNGIMYRNFADVYQINKLVAYVPVDSTRFYVLDASGKFNNCNEVPADLLNSYGLYIDKDKDRYGLVLLKNDEQVKQEVSVDAEIKPDGTMAGTAELTSYGYLKTGALELHDHLDEQKYKEALTDNDNNLRILSLELENDAIDSLPLTQKISFKLDLPGTDDKYIYFSPNLFTALHTNPFISERRFSNIDFGCNYLFSIDGKYKIPAGYKTDVLPKTGDIAMPDKSITFKRVVLEQDGYIVVRYVINYKKYFFTRGAYFDIHEYFKKMIDMLNEQIILKKTG